MIRIEDVARACHRTIGRWNCDYHDAVEGLKGFGSDNKETLAELVWTFFEFWAWRHDFNNSVVSIRTLAPISKAEKEWTKRVGNERHLVSIEVVSHVSLQSWLCSGPQNRMPCCNMAARTATQSVWHGKWLPPRCLLCVVLLCLHSSSQQARCIHGQQLLLGSCQETVGHRLHAPCAPASQYAHAQPPACCTRIRLSCRTIWDAPWIGRRPACCTRSLNAQPRC